MLEIAREGYFYPRSVGVYHCTRQFTRRSRSREAVAADALSPSVTADARHVRPGAGSFIRGGFAMIFTRRDTLQLGLAAGLAGFGSTIFMPFTARAQAKGDSYKTDGGEIVINPISHASFVMSVPGLVIYNDPVGGKAAYDGHAAAGLVLVTHEHQDHFDPETLAALVGADTKLLVNPAVHGEAAGRAQGEGDGDRQRRKDDGGHARDRGDPGLQHHRGPQEISSAGPRQRLCADDRRQARLYRGRYRGHPRDARAEGHRHRLRADEPALHHGRSTRRARRSRNSSRGWSIPIITRAATPRLSPTR